MYSHSDVENVIFTPFISIEAITRLSLIRLTGVYIIRSLLYQTFSEQNDLKRAFFPEMTVSPASGQSMKICERNQ